MQFPSFGRSSRGLNVRIPELHKEVGSLPTEEESNRLGVEHLEDRVVPAGNIYTVMTNSDAIRHTGLSLRDAIVTANQDLQANPGNSDIINFAPALAGKEIVLSQAPVETLTLGTAVTSAGSITIDGSGLGISIGLAPGTVNNNILTNDALITTVIDGITFAGGSVTSGVGGGSIQNLGNLTLNGCTVTGGSAVGKGVNGGGIFNSNSLTLNGTTVKGSVTGVVILNGATPTAIPGLGGGIYNTGMLSLVENASSITNNSAFGDATAGGGQGGGIYNQDGGTVTVSNSSIGSNQASVAGGGICNTTAVAGGRRVAHGYRINHLQQSRRQRGRRGRQHQRERNSHRHHRPFDDHTGNAVVTTTDQRARGNAPALGGGIFNSTTAGTGLAIMTVADSTISANTATDPATAGAEQTEGAGIFNGFAIETTPGSDPMTVIASTLHNNTGTGTNALDAGGGVFNVGKFSC